MFAIFVIACLKVTTLLFFWKDRRKGAAHRVWDYVSSKGSFLVPTGSLRKQKGHWWTLRITDKQAAKTTYQLYLRAWRATHTYDTISIYTGDVRFQWNSQQPCRFFQQAWDIHWGNVIASRFNVQFNPRRKRWSNFIHFINEDTLVRTGLNYDLFRHMAEFFKKPFRYKFHHPHSNSWLTCLLHHIQLAWCRNLIFQNVHWKVPKISTSLFPFFNPRQGQEPETMNISIEQNIFIIVVEIGGKWQTLRSIECPQDRLMHWFVDAKWWCLQFYEMRWSTSGEVEWRSEDPVHDIHHGRKVSSAKIRGKKVKR